MLLIPSLQLKQLAHSKRPPYDENMVRSNWLVTLPILAAIGLLAAEWKVVGITARGDAFYDGIVARSLLAGHGLSTSLMPLGGLKMLAERALSDHVPWISAHKFPFSQLRIAIFGFVLGKVDETTLQLASAVPWLAAAVLFSVLSLRYFEPVIGVLCALGFVLTDSYFLAASGLSFSFDILLFLILIFLSFRQSRSPKIARAFSLGFLFAVAVLHRYSMILWFPALILAATGGTRPFRVRSAFTCLGGASLLLLPFWAISLSKFGTFFPSYLKDSLFIHRTPALPFDPWYVLNWPDVRSAMFNTPNIFAEKWIHSLMGVTQALFLNQPTDKQLFYFGITILASWGTVRAYRVIPILTLAAISNVILFVAVHLFLSRSDAYFLYLKPLVWLAAGYGSQLFLDWVKTLPTYPRRLGEICFWIVLPMTGVLIITGSDLVSMISNPVEHPYNHEDAYRNLPEIVSVIESMHLAPDAVIVGGDRPWDIAWTLPFRTIPIPPTISSLQTLQSLNIVPDVIFIPSDLGFKGDGEIPPGWRAWRGVEQCGLNGVPGFRESRRISNVGAVYTRNASEPKDITARKWDAVKKVEQGLPDRLKSLASLSWNCSELEQILQDSAAL